MGSLSFGAVEEGKEKRHFRKEGSGHNNTALPHFYFSKSAVGLYWNL